MKTKMRKVLFRILNTTMLLVLVAYGQAWAVGTVTQTVATVCEPSTSVCFKTLTFVCIADASAATYPSTAISAANHAQLKGWALMMGSTLNGATAPTALWDIAITEGGVDVLGTAGADRPGTTAVSSQFRPLTSTSYLMPGLRPVADTWTLAITGNAVNSAVATIKLFFVPLYWK